MSQCLYPFINEGIPLPCGKCAPCRQKRVAGWSARMLKEDKHSLMSFFVTLTYSTDHVMFCPNGRLTLWPSHLTSYWKMLRKNWPKTKFKYYACGEYGSNKKRPHYHAIIFIKHTNLKPIEIVKGLEKYWPHGDIFIGTCTGESVAYTLKYISKKGSVPQYKGDTRIPEFQRTSKGLGIDYLTTIGNWHQADLLVRSYVPLNGGIRAPMPRYYKDKLYTKEQRKLIGEYMAAISPARTARQTIEQRKVSDNKVNS
jgi:hypothetical protein